MHSTVSNSVSIIYCSLTLLLTLFTIYFSPALLRTLFTIIVPLRKFFKSFAFKAETMLK